MSALPIRLARAAISKVVFAPRMRLPVKNVPSLTSTEPPPAVAQASSAF